MSGPAEGTFSRVIARVRAILPTDWFGTAGNRFRHVTAAMSQATSDFAEKHKLHSGDLLDEGVELGRRKLQGLANSEYAAAVKNFAEAEQKKIEIELQRRSLESRVRKEEAEARISEIKALDAEFEFAQKLTRAGVILRRDATGNLSFHPVPQNLDNPRLNEHLQAALVEDRASCGQDPQSP
jgi:hypothetical protein